MLNIYQQKNYNRSFGTYPLTGQELENTLKHVIDAGYRSIDTAQMYKNEEAIGNFIQQCDIPREQLLITTKVHPDNFNETDFIPSVNESLNKLALDYVDCLLLHWPCPSGDNTLSLKLLEKCQQMGLSKHIGVSNYNAKMMRQCQDIITTPILCNQVEFHPLLNQDILRQTAKETHILLTAYCPVARGEVFKYKLFDEIAQALHITPAQVVLKWILQKGVTLQVMSTNPSNIRHNYQLDHFSLSDAQMRRIDELTETGYRIVDENLSPWCPEWD